MDYIITRDEYIQILSYCTSIHQTHMFGNTQGLLMDLLDITVHQAGNTFIIPERLMRRVAIENLCDMCLIQYRDSNGEIDYATLGRHTPDVINSILRNI